VIGQFQLLTKIFDVNVSAEARVVGEIVAGVIGIVVNDDVIRVPQPSIDISKIVGRDAPVPIVEPETAGAAAAETPDVVGTKAA